ncbi:MAG TPA: ParA family protein [Planctomycetes bacterium]|nr:ParA family protein [Planctomycetota bacterium]
MRRIALINQKGGVGKTTTAVNLGAALAETGRRVVLFDLDPQANLSIHLGLQPEPGAATTYRVLLGEAGVADAVVPTATEGLFVVPTDIDLSGAELELAGAFGRETILRDAVARWEREHLEAHGEAPADYVLFDCPPSLGLLSVNALAATEEIFLAVQTQFFALQGLSKLLEIVDLVKSRLHPELEITGIVACLYDSRQRLAREVLAEIRKHFPTQVFRSTIQTNVKLAEAPSFGQSILQYAPGSPGARDYRALAREVLAQERPGEPSAGESGAEPTVEVTPAKAIASSAVPPVPPGTPAVDE